MSEKPILFSSEMVRAILEGRKTQTRRVCKDQTAESYQYVEDMEVFPNNKKRYTGWAKDCGFNFLLPTKPKYQVGDKLWVKERYAFGGNGVFYEDSTDGSVKIAWRNKLFMPKKYARIWLEVTNVRVERLQDISEEDIIAEGIKDCKNLNIMESNRFRFLVLWDSINAKKYLWKSNPWVWVIEFKRIK